MSQYLFFLLILACPLMMVFMMRGGHRHGSHGHAHMGPNGDASGDGDPAPIDELKRQRDELDREISLREGR